MTNDEWKIIPTVDDDGTINASRMVREVAEETLALLPNLVEISVVLDGKREVRKLDGRSDDLIAQFERHQALDVCRWFDVDRWQWSAYCSDDHLDRLRQEANERFGADDGVVTSRVDPGNEVYHSTLLPDRDERQTAEDVLLLTMLAAQGDPGAEPRSIDHVLLFSSADQADAAAEKLEAHDFSNGEIVISHVHHHDDGTGVVEVAERAAPNLHLLRQTRAELLTVTAECNPSYDGWGCPVVKTTPVRKRRRWLGR